MTMSALDFPTVQAAIDTGVPDIYLPAGVYDFTLLELGEGQTLRGDGPGKTILRLPDNVAGYAKDVGLQAITAKSGVQSCAIRDLEIDGNAPNNRDWGNGWQNWEPLEYDLNYTHGLYFGTYGGRVPPKTMALNNLYIHDTVRNGLVWSNTVITGDNLRFRNSDADHLIYASGGQASMLTNIVLEGYCRQGMAISQGQTFRGVTFRNLADNPTIYDSTLLVVFRNAGYSDWLGVTVETSDPTIASGLVSMFGSGKLSDVVINFGG